MGWRSSYVVIYYCVLIVFIGVITSAKDQGKPVFYYLFEYKKSYIRFMT